MRKYLGTCPHHAVCGQQSCRSVSKQHLARDYNCGGVKSHMQELKPETTHSARPARNTDVHGAAFNV